MDQQEGRLRDDVKTAPPRTKLRNTFGFKNTLLHPKCGKYLTRENQIKLSFVLCYYQCVRTNLHIDIKSLLYLGEYDNLKAFSAYRKGQYFGGNVNYMTCLEDC